MNNRETKYGGISGVELEVDEFDLGYGIIIRKCFIYLYSPYLVAYEPIEKLRENLVNKPWPFKVAGGGNQFYINAEIKIPKDHKLKTKLDQDSLIWFIACLIRMLKNPYVTVPVISDSPFNETNSPHEEPSIHPNEIVHRITRPPKENTPILTIESLGWVRQHLLSTLELINSNTNFYTALKAFDSATIYGKNSSSLLTLWSAIEQLFSNNQGELKFRVSAYLASYLAKSGKKRLELFKEIQKLYNERSIAAHTTKELEIGSLVKSYVLMRNALVKLIEEERLPTQKDLEDYLFTNQLRQ